MRSWRGNVAERISQPQMSLEKTNSTSASSSFEKAFGDPFELKARSHGRTVKRQWPYETESSETAVQSPPGMPPLSAKCALRNTHIILDWDDTLFPTSWMRKVQLELHKRYCSVKEVAVYQNGPMEELWSVFDLKHLSSADRVLLRRLELSSIEMLKACVHASDQVYIVTNAQKQWVDLSALKFMPKLLAVITKYQVPIISARDAAREEAGPDMWKINTFKSLMVNLLESTTRHRRAPSLPQGNRAASARRWWHNLRPGHSRVRSGGIVPTQSKCVLVSIGDSECERGALLRCRDVFYGHAYFKSIKLVDAPHPLLLKRQQEYVRRCLADVVAVQDSVDMIFEPPPQPSGAPEGR